MDTFDLVLLFVIVFLGLLAAILRPVLAKKQGKPLSMFFQIQGFFFPAILLLAAILSLRGTADILFWAVLLAILEEVVFNLIRKRRERRDDST